MCSYNKRFFFLQGMDVCMGNASISMGSQNRIFSEKYHSVKCDVGKYGDNRSPIYCNDGKVHNVTRGTIRVNEYGDSAVLAEGKLEILRSEVENAPFKVKETNIKLNTVSLIGANFLTTVS